MSKLGLQFEARGLFKKEVKNFYKIYGMNKLFP